MTIFKPANISFLMFKNINIFTRALFQGFVLEPLIKTGYVSAIQIEQALCIALNLHYLCSGMRVECEDASHFNISFGVQFR